MQQRKSKKYFRDINDYKTDQVFKWQNQIGENDPISTFSTLEKIVRIYTQYGNRTLNHNTEPKTTSIKQSQRTGGIQNTMGDPETSEIL